MSVRIADLSNAEAARLLMLSRYYESHLNGKAETLYRSFTQMMSDNTLTVTDRSNRLKVLLVNSLRAQTADSLMFYNTMMSLQLVSDIDIGISLTEAQIAGVVGSSYTTTLQRVNRAKPWKRAQVFRDGVRLLSDELHDTANGEMNKLLSRTQSDFSEVKMKHIASSEACVFCKTFDMDDYYFSADSKRPHIGCKCSRVPVFDAEPLMREPWRQEFEDMTHRIAAETEGNSSAVMKAVRKEEYRKSRGRS